MARHRRRPVSRHQARKTGDDAAARPHDRRLAAAMRRVVVTPTFVTGLGVVVAAVLAYPMQTVFSYAEPGGSTCKMVSCGVSSGPGGEPAAVPGGHHLSTSPAPPGTSPAGSGASGSPHEGGTTGSGHPIGNVPSLSYQTSQDGSGSFGATITIAFRPGYAPTHWRLRFGYPAARILKVWTGKYLRHGTHSAVVTFGDWPRQAAYGKPVTVSIGVTGEPGPPAKCSFNGQNCQITESRAARQGSPGSSGN